MAFGPADRDGTNQNKDRTTEGSVSQIVGHRPGRHFPIITGPSNRHNHYQRQKCINKQLLWIHFWCFGQLCINTRR